jgi:hypothetical protein
MRRQLGFLLALILAAVLSAALSGPFTAMSVLGWALMLGALIGPMYLAPRRYAEWTKRCKFPGFRRQA